MIKKILFLLVLLIVIIGCSSVDKTSTENKQQPILISEDLELLSFSAETRTASRSNIQDEELETLLEEVDKIKAEIAEAKDIDLGEQNVEGEEQLYYNMSIKITATVLNEGEEGQINALAKIGTYPSTEDVVLTADNNSNFFILATEQQSFTFEKNETKTIELYLDFSISETDPFLGALLKQNLGAESILDILYYDIELTS